MGLFDRIDNAKVPMVYAVMVPGVSERRVRQVMGTDPHGIYTIERTAVGVQVWARTKARRDDLYERLTACGYLATTQTHPHP